MATVSATVRRAVNAIIGKGDAGTLRTLGVRTIELAPSASGTIIDFKLRVSLNDRIDATSTIYYDDLSTTGAPTLDLGFYPVDGNFTADDDALNDGLTLATALTYPTRAPLVKDIANTGKQVWEFISGATKDTGGFADVKGIVRDAATAGLTASVVLDMKIYTD